MFTLPVLNFYYSADVVIGFYYDFLFIYAGLVVCVFELYAQCLLNVVSPYSCLERAALHREWSGTQQIVLDRIVTANNAWRMLVVDSLKEKESRGRAPDVAARWRPECCLQNDEEETRLYRTTN